MRHLAVAVIGCVLMSLPAGAQTNPPSTTANTSNWMTQLKAGQWRATKLKGLNVYNNNNEKIGDINDVIVDQNGRVDAVVIGVGGFLGAGEHDVAVPLNQIKFMDQARDSSRPAESRPARSDSPREYPDHAVLNMTKDQLKAAPEFKYTR